jgi:hypothetical protein
MRAAMATPLSIFEDVYKDGRRRALADELEPR